jgi:hypothetical protein
VHSAVFAPALASLICNSVCPSADGQMPIASVVMGKYRKIKSSAYNGIYSKIRCKFQQIQMNKILLFTFLAITFLSCKNNKCGCIEGDCQNGYGTIRYTNGGTATGNFVNGKLNGYGEIVWGKGKFEGNSHKGNFENGISKGKATIYIAAFDATLVGISNGKYDMDYRNDPITGHYRVCFGENSLWEGTFEGDFVNGTSKEWEERINIKHAKKGKYVAKNASLFLSAIFCFKQDKAVQNTHGPLTKIYNKDLTTEVVSDEEIQELYDSIQSQKKLLMDSHLKLNQLEEFDKNIPVKGDLLKLTDKMLDKINKNTPKLLALLAQPPSKEKFKGIYNHTKPLDDELDRIEENYSKTYKKFEDEYILFYKD